MQIRILPVQMFRLILRILAILLLGFVLVAIAFPVWLPWLITGVGGRFGLKVDSVDRQGYTRLELQGVGFEAAGFDLTVESINIPVWPRWLVVRDPILREEDSVRIEGWHLAVTGAEGEGDSEAVSLAAIYHQINDQMPAVLRFVPNLEAADGHLLVAEQAFRIEQIQWRAPVLSLVGGPAAGPWSARASVGLPDDEPWVIDAAVEPWKASATATLSAVEAGLELSFGLQWQASAIGGKAEFGPDGLLPESALLQSEVLRFDPELLGVTGYEPIGGTASASWVSGQFKVSADLSAAPLAGQGDDRPAIAATVQAGGDLNGIRFDSFEVSLPWATARLSQPISLTYGPGFLDQSARLDFDVDLATSPLPATGRVSGVAVVNAFEGRLPTVAATFKVEDLAVADFQGIDAEASTVLDYPNLLVERLALGVGEDSTVGLSGSVDLGAQSLEGRFSARVSPDLLEDVLPADLQVGMISLEGHLAGPWTSPGFSLDGQVDEMDLPGLLPGMISLSLTGCGMEVDQAIVRFETETDELRLNGGVSFAEGRIWLGLRGLELTRGGEVVLASSPGSLLTSDLVSSLNGEMRLVGDGRSLSLAGEVSWPGSANWMVEARHLDEEVVLGLLEEEVDWLEIEYFRSEGSWRDGPAVFSVESSGGIVAGDDTVSFRFRIDGADRNIGIEELVVSSDGGDVLKVNGRIPMELTPSAENLYRVDWDSPVDLTARTTPNPGFWDRMATLSGFDLTRPRLDVALRGKMGSPVGTFRFTARALNLQLDGQTFELPPVTGIELNAEVTEDQIILNEGRVEIEGESVSVAGEMPLGRDQWLRLALEKELPDLNKATLRLRADDTEVKAFARFLPTVLSPTGRLDLDLTLAPDRMINGTILLENAALRPIRPFGTMSEIGARIEFDGRKIVCEEVTAVIGGQKASLAGELNWDEKGAIDYDFTVKGTKVPLVREPGLVIRSDLDLRLNGASDGPVLLSGEVNLQDSLFVADLGSLLSGSVDSPSRRPPYFSIEAEPFADWVVDLKVKGPEFLRVETPVFKGVASADFALTGTLRKPKALGDLQVDSGAVEFPFATLKIKSGTLSIREENPFDVLLDLQAGSRVFGFDVSMSVEGYASAPRLFFESEPNLGSDAVLLMLTTGEVPNRNGYYSVQQKMTKLAVYLGRNLLTEFGIGGGSESRFVFESGSDISQKGRETLNIEVLLTDQWSIVGGYDEFDSYNGGIKWKVYSK